MLLWPQRAHQDSKIENEEVRLAIGQMSNTNCSKGPSSSSVCRNV